MLMMQVNWCLYKMIHYIIYIVSELFFLIEPTGKTNGARNCQWNIEYLKSYKLQFVFLARISSKMLNLKLWPVNTVFETVQRDNTWSMAWILKIKLDFFKGVTWKIVFDVDPYIILNLDIKV